MICTNVLCTSWYKYWQLRITLKLMYKIIRVFDTFSNMGQIGSIMVSVCIHLEPINRLNAVSDNNYNHN